MARANGEGTPLQTCFARRSPPASLHSGARKRGPGGGRQLTKRLGRSHHFCPKNSLSAATTRRLASSVPTVMRNAFGSL